MEGWEGIREGGRQGSSQCIANTEDIYKYAVDFEYILSLRTPGMFFP